MKTVVMRAGQTGIPKQPKIVVTGTGSSLQDPIPPALTPPVLAQFLMGGSCWEASYSSPLVNSSEIFKSKYP